MCFVCHLRIGSFHILQKITTSIQNAFRPASKLYSRFQNINKDISLAWNLYRSFHKIDMLVTPSGCWIPSSLCDWKRGLNPGEPRGPLMRSSTNRTDHWSIPGWCAKMSVSSTHIQCIGHRIPQSATVTHRGAPWSILRRCDWGLMVFVLTPIGYHSFQEIINSTLKLSTQYRILPLIISTSITRTVWSVALNSRVSVTHMHIWQIYTHTNYTSVLNFRS
jgi:hypothetical protein